MPPNPAEVSKAIEPTFGIIKAKTLQNNPLDFFSTMPFWVTEMLYTSKESWEHVESKIRQKKYDLIRKKLIKIQISDFWLKIEAD